MLKTTLLGALIITAATTLAQIALPQASATASVSTTVGLTDVKIDYSRPKMKGRKIFGEGASYLVPFGALWRTGANSGTIISFSDAVQFGDVKVDAGKYLLFSIPGASSWEVMLYSDISLGGNTNGYDKSKEVARVTVTPGKRTETVETLTFNISDLSDDNTTANIELAWENTSVKVPLKVDFDSKIMAAIEKSTKVNVANYQAAANYYFQTNRDLDQAIKWMDMYLAENSKQFWHIHTKAQMLKKKGDVEGARAAAQLSLDLAKAAPNDFGYVKMNEDLLKELPEPAAKSKKKK